MTVGMADHGEEQNDEERVDRHVIGLSNAHMVYFIKVLLNNKQQNLQDGQDR